MLVSTLVDHVLHPVRHAMGDVRHALEVVGKIVVQALRIRLHDVLQPRNGPLALLRAQRVNEGALRRELLFVQRVRIVRARRAAIVRLPDNIETGELKLTERVNEQVQAPTDTQAGGLRASNDDRRISSSGKALGNSCR